MSVDERLMAELVEARNARLAQRLREDAQHLAELNADGAPCSWKAMLGPRASVAFRLASGAQPFAYLDGGAFAARLSNDAPKLFQVTSDWTSVPVAWRCWNVEPTIVDRRSDLTLITARDIGLISDKASFYVETSSLASCTIHAPPGLGVGR